VIDSRLFSWHICKKISMKNFILFLIIFVPAKCLAQSSTILPNGIDLPKVTALATCTTPEKGRMVFNTTDNKAYYCNGLNWQEMTGGGFSLPYSATGDSNSNLFKIVNEGNGRAVYAETQGNALSIGIQAVASHSTPTIDNFGMFAQNKSTNNLGAGIFGRHDGSGIGVWGVTANAGIGVKGIAFPIEMGGTGTGIGVWAESTAGYGLYAKSKSWPAVKAESETSFGLHGLSKDDAGVRGQSVDGIGVYGTSYTRYAVYGYSYGTEGYGIYGSGLYGNAGYFDGNVKVKRDLMVSEDKGIIQNSSSTQLKYYTGKASFEYTLGAFSTAISGEIFIAAFSAKPAVYIADVEDQSGSYYKVIVTVVAVTDNSVKLRFYNASDAPITFSGTWNFVAIGSK
jgi:hypothetical protein